MSEIVILDDAYVTSDFLTRMVMEIDRHAEAFAHLMPLGPHLEDPKWREALRSEVQGHTKTVVAMWSECMGQEVLALRREIAELRARP